MMLVLASSSEARKNLLASIGIVPDYVEGQDVDETPLKHEKPSSYVRRVSYEKALAAQKKYPEALVLSADTIGVLGGKVLQKASSIREAHSILSRLSGRRHTMLTGVCVMHKDKCSYRSVSSRVSIARLSPWDIDFLCEEDEWKYSSGCYRLYGRMARYIRNINGVPSSIVGLPLRETSNMLRSFGVN